MQTKYDHEHFMPHDNTDFLCLSLEVIQAIETPIAVSFTVGNRTMPETAFDVIELRENLMSPWTKPIGTRMQPSGSQEIQRNESQSQSNACVMLQSTLHFARRCCCHVCVVTFLKSGHASCVMPLWQHAEDASPHRI